MAIKLFTLHRLFNPFIGHLLCICLSCLHSTGSACACLLHVAQVEKHIQSPVNWLFFFPPSFPFLHLFLIGMGEYGYAGSSAHMEVRGLSCLLLLCLSRLLVIFPAIFPAYSPIWSAGITNVSHHIWRLFMGSSWFPTGFLHMFRLALVPTL